MSLSDHAIDVTIFSAFTALSTLGSIIQQLHYATSWVVIKEAQFDKAVQSLDHPGLALGGAAQPVDVVLFFIRKLYPMQFQAMKLICPRILLLQCHVSQYLILVSHPNFSSGQHSLVLGPFNCLPDPGESAQTG
jgi:hypothetical protein